VVLDPLLGNWRHLLRGSQVPAVIASLQGAHRPLVKSNSVLVGSAWHWIQNVCSIVWSQPFFKSSVTR